MKTFSITTLFALFAAFALSGCTTLTVTEPLTQKHGGGDADAQMEFWHALYESKLTSNDEAFHGFLLFIDGKDESADYAARVQSLKSRGLLAADFAGESNAAATRGDLEAAPAYTMGDAVMPTDGTAPAVAAGDTTTQTPTAAPDTLRARIERDGYTAAGADFLTSEKLTGAKVYDANDTLVGEVGTLVLTADGKTSQAIIDVGGFLGMGEKPVALNLADIDILRNAAGDDVRVYVSKTKAELEALPKFEG